LSSSEVPPTAAGRLNQVELWLSGLARTLLERGNLRSVEHLRNRTLAFSADFNRIMARQFKMPL
jgi:hypothetical protein